ncbi:MAG: ROK family protein [Chloroflexota bacterium]
MLAGIDLGGTQVRLAVARTDGRITGSARTRTSAVGGPAGMAEWVASELDRLRGRARVRRIAIGAPGPLDAERGVLVNPANLPGWEDAPLAALVSRATGVPTLLQHDAKVAALAEYHQGAGRGARALVYITWSTGIGGGVIIEGRLFSGAHGTAGELGHMIVDPDGPLDGCGQRGCLEVFAGGAQLARQTGEPASDLFQAAEAGNVEALAVVKRAATYMGIGLVNVTNLYDPDVIVMGGGISKSWKLVGTLLAAALQGSPFIVAARRPALRRARLGDRVGLVGAVEWARANL